MSMHPNIRFTATTKPAWLANNDQVYGDPNLITTFNDRASHIQWDVPGRKYALDVDHWANEPLRRGFTPWAGGASAPADLDDEGVLVDWGSAGRPPMADQIDVRPLPYTTNGINAWAKAPPNFPRIIGYRQRPSAPAAPVPPWKPDEATVRHCLSIMPHDKGNTAIANCRKALEALLPPDPVDELARKLWSIAWPDAAPADKQSTGYAHIRRVAAWVIEQEAGQ